MFRFLLRGLLWYFFQELNRFKWCWLHALIFNQCIRLEKREYIDIGRPLEQKCSLFRHLDEYASEQSLIVVQIGVVPNMALDLEVDAGERLV